MAKHLLQQQVPPRQGRTLARRPGSIACLRAARFSGHVRNILHLRNPFHLLVKGYDLL